MDASYKTSSSPASSRSSPIPKFSRAAVADEADENELIENHMTSPLQFQRKPPTKNFMSPTISASSKASRKKVLVERNQEFSTFSDTLQGLHNHNSNVDKKSAFVMRVSDSDDEGQNSSSKPYDPFTNYLSPRPKFLRYKPNRRRQIRMSQENELSKEEHGDFDPRKVTEGADSSLDAHCHTAPSPPHEATQETHKTNADDDREDEEDFEEFEDESCFSLKGVLKLLLLLGVIFFSVVYICSMNSPTPPPAIQAWWDLKAEYHRVHIQLFEGGLGFLGKGIGSGADNWYKEQVSVGENHNMVEEEVSVGTEENKVYGQESAVCEPVEGNTTAEEGAEENHVSAQEYKKLPLSGDVNVDHRMEITEVVSDDFKAPEASETAEKAEPLDEFQVQPHLEYKVFGQEDESEIAIRSDLIPGLVGASEIFEEIDLFQDTDISLRSENEAFGQTEDGVRIETREEVAPGSVEELEEELAAEDGVRTEIREEATPGSVEEPEKEVVESSKMGLENQVPATSTISVEAAIGVCIVVVAITMSSIWVFLKKSLPSSEKQPLSPGKPQVAKEISNVVVKEAPSEKLESFIHHSSSIQSMDGGASTDFYESRLGPTVELLGEFDVGEVRSTLRSHRCSRNSSTMVGIEMNSNFAFMENEMKVESKANGTVFIQSVQQSVLETISSPPSYGSFTAEKKIVKKEEGKVATTPVRRSSRIRNRSVMSP